MVPLIEKRLLIANEVDNQLMAVGATHLWMKGGSGEMSEK